MKTALRLFVGSILLLSVTAAPVFAQQLERGSKGTLGFMGRHDFRRGGSEITFTAFTFRNFNPRGTITITDITIFDADGDPLKTMPSPDPFPGGFNDVLGPNETANFSTIVVFGEDPNGEPGFIQVIVNWQADREGFDLYGNTSRVDRKRDTPGGPLLETRTRGRIRCVSLEDDDDDDDD